MKYFQRLLLSIVIIFSLVQCSNSPSQKEIEQTEQIEQSEETAQIRILDEVPQDIKETENLTVFSGDTEPANSIELIPEQTFGKSGEPYLTQVQNCVVDDKDRVIILNSGSNYAQQVYVYNEDGTFHTAIGRSGNGPGEYGYVLGMRAQPGKILIRDVRNKRFNIYNSTDYSLERTMLIERLEIRDHKAVEGLEFGMMNPRNDGNYLVSFYQQVSETGWPVAKYLLMDSDGAALDYNILEFRRSFKAQGKTESMSAPMSLKPMPFMGSTVTGISDEGELYSVWNHDFLIKKYDAKGNYQSAIYYPVKGSPFDLSSHTPTPFYDQSDVMKAIDIHDEELPEANPIIDRLMVDDENRIWVAVPTGGQSDSYEWWILEESGKLLAKLTLPGEQEIYDIKNGYLYSKKTKEETGIEYVVKYRIALTKK
ncbi:6-bladed beta-propeller protein [Fodinibius salinus]|uniref:6-bladed beta-propeller protein n=1 Tax=Fodinibius salinus TaxID=860790 RepID=A0A5D3YN02_9BACT|nr:6-bladed beta-propeller [Fodinibius salinus]TYP95565.1 6-bladed beta-propeller protein [Fodinibius salinus]